MSDRSEDSEHRVDNAEQRRLDALRDLRVMDSGGEDLFDQLVELASAAFGVPIAALSLIDGQREWFKAATVEPQGELPRDHAACVAVVEERATIIVPDTLTDPRFCDLPQVRHGRIRFYAAAPVTTTGGHVVGSVCLKDFRPRAFTASDARHLESFARMASTLLESRREHLVNDDELDRVGTILRNSIHGLVVFEPVYDDLTGALIDFRYRDLNPRAQHLLQLSETDATGRTMTELFPSVREEYLDRFIAIFEFSQVAAFRSHYQDARITGVFDQQVFRVDDWLVVTFNEVSEAEVAQRAAEEAAARLTAAAEASGVGLWDAFPKTGHCQYSDTWYTQLGYEPGALPPTIETFVNLVHPDDLPIIEAIRDEILSSARQDFDVTLRLRHADGHWVHVRDKGAVAGLDADGRVDRIAGVHIDVSAEYAAYERLETAIRAARIGFWDWSVERDAVVYHPSWFALLGRDPADHAQHLDTFTSLIHPRDLGGVLEQVEAYVKGESDTLDATFRMRHADGHWVHIRSRGSAVERDHAGRPTRISGIHIDVSSEVEARDRLRLLDQAIMSADDSVVITSVTPDGQRGDVAFVNPAFERLTGYRLNEVTGRRLEQFLAGPGTDPDEINAISRCIAGGTPYRGEVLKYRRDGAPFWVDVHVAPVLDERGTVTHCVTIHRDSTERRRDRDRLASALRRAEDASRAKTTFVATMSHEIRTPLNGVLGLAEQLTDTTLDAEQEELLAGVMESARLLRTLVDDILDFSKIEAGKTELEAIPFQPATVAGHVETLLAPAATKKGLDLRAEIHPDIPTWVTGDPTRLRQILINLVGNAIKFTETGSVTLTVEPGPRGREGTILFSVTDTGPGIPPNRVQELFSAFTQADAGTARRYGGSGLGLAICKRLVDLMQGTIEVDSLPGTGTTFRVLAAFPRAMAPRSSDFDPDRDAASRGERPLQGLRLLVVEDNPINQRVALGLLARYGATASTADDGDQGVRRWHAGKFDAVLMDAHMPVLDGIDATRRIREIEAREGRPRTPVIALTASALEEDRRRCIAAGMDAFVGKPVDARELIARIVELTKTRGARVQQPTAVAIRSEPDTPIDELPVIDTALTLRGCVDDAELASELLDEFLARAADTPTVIAEALANERFDTAAGEAHRIKGAAASLGLRRLHAASGALEAAARRSERTPSSAALGVFSTALSMTCEAIPAAIRAINPGAARADEASAA